MSGMRREVSVPRHKYLNSLVLISLGILIGMILSNSPLVPAPLLLQSQLQPRFSLLVALTFKEAKYKKQFLEYFAPLAKYIKEHELDTVAYEVLESDKDPLRVLVLERYKDKENAFLKTHRFSKPFLDYRPKMQAMMDAGQMTQSGESYLDSMIGFGDRVTA